MDDADYTPSFVAVDAIKTLVLRNGSSMGFAEVQNQTGYSLDCPFIYTVLVADPTIKMNRKTCTIRIFSPIPFPENCNDEAAWFARAEKGVPERSLCTRGANVMKLRQRQGRAAAVDDWAETERVWFPFAPRVPQLSQGLVDTLLQ
jgi:hypothetical protein